MHRATRCWLFDQRGDSVGRCRCRAYEDRISCRLRACDPERLSRLHGRSRPGVRRDLIGGYIDNAKINWAHLALAQLIDHDFVDRVLTTNLILLFPGPAPDEFVPGGL